MTKPPGPAAPPESERAEPERGDWWRALGATTSERLTALLGDVPAVVWVTDRELRFRYLSGADVGALPVKERLGRGLVDQFSAGERTEPALEAHRRALAGETTHFRAEHHGAVYEASARPLRAAGGEVIGVVGVGVDATHAIRERDAIEARLRQRERELATLAENSPDAILRYDRDLRITFVNAAFLRATGAQRDAILGRRMEDAFPEPLVREWTPRLRRVLERGEAAETEFEFEGPAGRRSYHSRAVPERDDAGAVVAILTTARDVTERVAAQEALRRSAEHFRALVEHGSDLISILDEDGVVRYASPSHERVLGYPPARLVGEQGFALVHPEDAEKGRRFIAEVVQGAGPPPPQTLRVRDAAGRWRSLAVVVADLRDDPAVRGIVANARDVTGQLQLEERLRQSQRLEALGQLAGGVAHDFNNILASVLLYGQALADALLPEDPRRADAEEIVRAARRGAAVAKQLLAFGRAQPQEVEVLDLAAVVRETGRLLRALLPASIRLELPPDGAAPALVRTSRAAVAQIVLNLAVNARDAMPEGGTFSLAVSAREGPGGGEALLRAWDTGPGVPPEIRERIFDPFFTTKPIGQGTGLGLATVYGLCRQFGGTVALDEASPRGAAFLLTFPRVAGEGAREDRAAAAPGAEPASAPGPRRRVLVVEDEAPIARVARRILEGAGYEVLVEPDGAAAVSRLRGGDRFDVVLTDAAMPAASGWQVADEVARLGRTTPVVLMSGHAELSPARQPSGREGAGTPAGFLQKPFTSVELLAAIRRALEREGAADA